MEEYTPIERSNLFEHSMMSMGFEGESEMNQSLRKTDPTTLKDSMAYRSSCDSDTYNQASSLQKHSLIFDPDINIDQQNYYSVVNTEGARDEELIGNRESLTFSQTSSNQTPDMESTTPPIYRERKRIKRAGKKGKSSFRQPGDKGFEETSCCHPGSQKNCTIF